MKRRIIPFVAGFLVAAFLAAAMGTLLILGIDRHVGENCVCDWGE